MDDRQRLEQLLGARYPCILIPTFEEAHVLSMVREVALQGSREMRLWSYSQGVRDGLLEGDKPIKDTEPPAAGLYYLLSNSVSGITVLLDIAEHLSDARVARLLRDLVEQQRDIRGHVLLIDHKDTLPDVIAHDAARLDLSMPDEKELGDLIRSTVRRENAEQKVEARVSASALKTMVRNLRGLSRRQAGQIIVDVITEDRKFNDSDINRIVARKRPSMAPECTKVFINVKAL
jgi:hypothetical protein